MISRNFRIACMCGLADLFMLAVGVGAIALIVFTFSEAMHMMFGGGS